MLSEIIKTEEEIPYFTYMWNLKKKINRSKLIDTEKLMVIR